MSGITNYNSSNCGSGVLGTGLPKCNIASWGLVNGIGLFEKGFTADLSTFTKTIVENAIKARKLHQAVGLFDFKQNNGKNGIATSSSQIKVVTQIGLPEFEFDFTKGGCFHKALFSLQGQDRWDLVKYYPTGVLFFLNDDNTKLKGADAGMFSVESMEEQNGNNPQKTTSMVQLTDANEYNTKFVFKTWDELGFNMSKINGVIDTDVNVLGTPTATSTTIQVQVVAGCNGSVISQLDQVSNWGLGGTSTATITAVSVNLTTGVYTFTLSGAIGTGKTIQPYLTDGTYAVAEDVNGAFYAGTSVLVTV